MRVTTWAEYGLIVCLHLAKRAGNGPVAARDMAEKEKLPADYVEQILLRLRRAGLVDSVRGARGGYELKREWEGITVKDVLDASEHGTFEVNCECHRLDLKTGRKCDTQTVCSIRPVWQLLKKRVDDTLGAIRLSDLLHDESEVREIVGLAAVAV
jgi:Rrf2 family protein